MAYRQVAAPSSHAQLLAGYGRDAQFWPQLVRQAPSTLQRGTFAVS